MNLNRPSHDDARANSETITGVPMTEQERRSLLKDEYLHIQRIIESFDARVISIKAWSVSASLAGIAAAFAAHSAQVLLLASISSLFFWMIEGVWKTFQYAHYGRNRKIEAYFAGREKDVVPLQIGVEWISNWREGGKKRLLMIMFWPHVALPHVFVFLAGVVIYLLVAVGMITMK